MTLHEPATLATDYLLAALAVWLAVRLRKADPPVGQAGRWLAHALLLTAASAFVGGSYHGFAPNFGSVVAQFWWWATLLIIHLLSGVMTMSWICELLPRRWHRRAPILVTTKVLGFATASALYPHFVVAIIDYGSTMFLWLVTGVMVRRPWRGPMLIALGLSGLAAAVQQLRLAPSARFNHNDLYHVIQAFALYAFYRAALRMDLRVVDRPKFSPQ